MEVISVTTFGYGKPTTKTHARCLDCEETGLYCYDIGCPAKYLTIKQAQESLKNK
jgi:hypothetical protein